MSLGIVKETIGKRCLLLFPPMIVALALTLASNLSQAAVERVIDYEYDNAGNIIRIVSQEQSEPPIISIITPNFINLGRTVSFTAVGSNLLDVDVTTDVPGLSVSAVNSAFDQVTFQLTASNTTPIGNAILKFTNGLGEAQETIFIAETPPALTTDPIPIAIEHNNTITNISLIFSDPRPENETYSIATDDASVADTVSSSFTILTGETQVDIALTGFAIGATSLNIDLSAKFYAYSFPVFVGKSYEELLDEFPDMGQRNLFAASVGVLLQDGTQFEPGTVTQVVGVEVGHLSGITLNPVGVSYGDGLVGRLMTGPVGVNLSDNVNLVFSPRVETIYGPLIDSIQPTVVTVGSTVDLTVSGLNLNEVIDITVTPATDITVDSFTVNPEGTQLTLTLTIDPLAALGERVVMLEDSNGVLPTRSGNPLNIDVQ